MIEFVFSPEFSYLSIKQTITVGQARIVLVSNVNMHFFKSNQRDRFSDYVDAETLD